jgi:hypothetical protein
VIVFDILLVTIFFLILVLVLVLVFCYFNFSIVMILVLDFINHNEIKKIKNKEKYYVRKYSYGI